MPPYMMKDCQAMDRREGEPPAGPFADESLATTGNRLKVKLTTRNLSIYRDPLSSCSTS